MARREKKSREFVVSFRVNRKEMQDLQLQVEESGLTLSTLLRERLNLGTGRKPPMRVPT